MSNDGSALDPRACLPAAIAAVAAADDLDSSLEALLDAAGERERAAAAQSISRLLAPRSIAVIGAGRTGGMGHDLVRSLADSSAREGIRTRVVTPHGTVLTLGRDTRSSRAIRLLTGSNHLAVDARAFRPLWRPALRAVVQRLRARVRR